MSDTDLRIEKTKDALFYSLIDNLENNLLKNITVEEICRTARVRKSTFYNHFSNKYDLFSYAVDRFLGLLNENKIVSDDPVEVVMDYISRGMDFALFKKDILVKPSRLDNTSTFVEIMSARIYCFLKSEFNQFELQGFELTSEPELISIMLTGSLIGLVAHYAMQGCEVNKEGIMRILRLEVEGFFGRKD